MGLGLFCVLLFTVGGWFVCFCVYVIVWFLLGCCLVVLFVIGLLDVGLVCWLFGVDCVGWLR